MICKCDICKGSCTEDDLWDDGNGCKVCFDCLRSGGYQWYKEEEELMAKKIDLSERLYCPKCKNFTYDVATRGCVTPHCSPSSLSEEDWIHQRIIFAKFMCPFCGKFVIDLDNKICLSCKAHLSRKAMKKQFHKARKRGDSDKTLTEKCSICGSLNTWPEIHYCFECRQVYRITGPKGDLFGYIDGAAKYNPDFFYFKIVETKDPTKVRASLGQNKDVVEKVVGFSMEGNPIVNGNEKKLEETFKIKTEEFNELDWEDANITIKGFTATVAVRYLKEDPDVFAILSYSIDDFREKVCPKIAGLLKENSKGKKK